MRKSLSDHPPARFIDGTFTKPYEFLRQRVLYCTVIKSASTMRTKIIQNKLSTFHFFHAVNGVPKLKLFCFALANAGSGSLYGVSHWMKETLNPKPLTHGYTPARGPKGFISDIF